MPFADLAVGEAADQLARLRAMDADALHALYQSHPELGRGFYPSIDGVVLPVTPMTAFSRQQQAPVPLLIGYNADEASLFRSVVHPAGAEFPPPPDGPESLDPTEIRDTFVASFGSAEAVDELFTLYPGLQFAREDARVRYLGDHLFGVHVDHASRQHASAGHPVFRYYFTAEPPSPRQTLGAFHSAEIPYVFGRSLPLFPVAEDQHLLVRDMGDRWFAFAATGVPDFPGRPSWPAFENANPRHMVFDRPSGIVEPLTPEPAFDLLRSRIQHLTAVAEATAPVATPARSPLIDLSDSSPSYERAMP
ncbi:MAG: carboxylesterase family protein [Acidimicrobiales bacterium]